MNEKCEVNFDCTDEELERYRVHYCLPNLPKDQLKQRVFEKTMQEAAKAEGFPVSLMG